MYQSIRRGGMNVSKVLACTDFRWDGIAPQSYKQETHSWKGVARHWLIGDGGETARASRSTPAASPRLRYIATSTS